MAIREHVADERGKGRLAPRVGHRHEDPTGAPVAQRAGIRRTVSRTTTVPGPAATGAQLSIPASSTGRSRRNAIARPRQTVVAPAPAPREVTTTSSGSGRVGCATGAGSTSSSPARRSADPSALT